MLMSALLPLKIVECIGHEIAVVGEGLRRPLAEELAGLHPHVVHQHVGIGDDDDVRGHGGFRQMRDRRTGGGLLGPAARPCGNAEDTGPVMRAAIA